MNVLSLFDGMSCGRIALERLGIKVDNYYSSEIDKYAMQVSEANYPDIIQIGDVTKINYDELPQIDLIMGGSPCQGFSFAGKQLAFDDPRSALFFCFWRAVKHLKPKYFLLENVRMKKEHLDVISEYMGVEPIFINSSLVSAQSRQRYYWTNIPNVEQPEERGIVLRDILEDQPQDPTLMSDKFVARNGDRNCMIDKTKEKAHNLSAMEYVKNGRQGNYLACDENGAPKHKPVKQTERNRRHLKQLDEKSLCMTATMYKGAGNNGMTLVPQNIETHDTPKQVGTAVDIKGHDQIKRVYSPDGKSSTLTTCGGGHREPKVLAGAFRGRYEDDGTIKQKLELRQGGKTNSLTTVQKDNVVTETITIDKEKKQLTIKEATKKGYTTIEDGDCFDMTFPNSKTRRGRNMKDKSNCLTAANYDYMRYEHSDQEQEVYWRKLTPVECERLQTVPDNYTNHVSNTQRYKMLGNGWTIEVIAHILKNMDLNHE